MLAFLMALPNLLFLFKQETTSEIRTFYLCTRNEIFDLNKISKFGNLIKVKKLDCESLDNAFKNFYIKKITYEINLKEKFILEARDSYQNNVFSIEISKSQSFFSKSTEKVVFYSSFKSVTVNLPLGEFTVTRRNENP